ncbi:sensor histidine kinase [Streptacidiphilus sp. MAP12-33]|uniref:sensor histidine kinase n=1 Tax=Streptacidiphilus sp. MAP12-33 TaxID=3156266 RepID=UPI0035161E5A
METHDLAVDRADEELSVQLAPRMAMAITAVVLVGFSTVSFTYVLSARHSTTGLVAAVGLLALMLTLQFLNSFPRLAPRLTRHAPLLLAAQLVIAYAPFPFFGSGWLTPPAMLAGSILLVLRATRPAWILFGAVVAGSLLQQMSLGFSLLTDLYGIIATTITGLVIFGLSRLTVLVAEVHRSRAELAQFAVTQERLRFARDLHDLLGYSLSTITLKCELVYRLLPAPADEARQELTEILDIARQALSDVRAVAHGYREMSLRSEVHDARVMLGMLGVTTEVDLGCGNLPAELDTALATVFREGLTNILRHSEVRRCRVSSGRDGGRVWFRLVNDGVPALDPEAAEEASSGGEKGSGIGNLTFRMERLGGKLTAGVREDGWFELEAQIPLEPAAAPMAALH